MSIFSSKELAASGEKEWYFYCPWDRKYRNSAWPNRVTVHGQTIDNILMPCDSVCSVLWRVKQGLSYFMHGVRV